MDLICCILMLSLIRLISHNTQSVTESQLGSEFGIEEPRTQMDMCCLSICLNASLNHLTSAAICVWETQQLGDDPHEGVG